MKKITQKITTVIMVLAMGFGIVAPAISTAPAYAEEKEGAAILKNCWEEGEGSQNGKGIVCVFRLVVNILSVLIGIVGVIGIVYVGIQYLTAGGNEEQVRKAKRRLIEIVIGLAAYAASYALLNWLIPDINTSIGEGGVIYTPAIISLIGV